MKTLKKFGKIAIVIALVAVYLNIGWAMGTYYHYNILGHEPQNFVQKIFCGGWTVFSYAQKSTLLGDQIFGMLVWPILLLFSFGSWLCYGIYYFLWLIFAGGIAKLLGLG